VVFLLHLFVHYQTAFLPGYLQVVFLLHLFVHYQTAFLPGYLQVVFLLLSEPPQKV
jgi:hypothetical protein